MAEHDLRPAPWKAFARGVSGIAVRIARTASDLAQGVAGTHAYDQYVAHCRAHHPDRPIPTREEFFRREFSAKWEGIRRCC